MSEVPSARMTVDEFLAWAEDRPGRYELVDGRVLAMAPERARHAKAKLAMHMALVRSAEGAGLPCHVLPDGMTVRIDQEMAYEPDALVYCGDEVPGDAIEIASPVIVVEILSPGTRRYDTGAKLAGYFSLPSVHHYLIVDADHRRVVHHARGDGTAIATRILGAGALRLDPPGLDLRVDDLFGGPADAA